MNKIVFSLSLFAFFTNHAMQNSYFEGLEEPFIDHLKQNQLAPFNMDEHKYAEDVSLQLPFLPIFLRDYEKNNYFNRPDGIDKRNRPVILKKTENAIENLKTALSFAGTCTYMHKALQSKIKNQEEAIITEFLFSNITQDFCCSSSSEYSHKKIAFLCLYNKHPNVLFLIGKILTYKTPYEQWRGFGDKNYTNSCSHRNVNLSFLNLLQEHINTNQFATNQPIFTEPMDLKNQIIMDLRLRDQAIIKDDIIKKMLRGAFCKQNEFFILTSFFGKIFNLKNTRLIRLPISIKKHGKNIFTDGNFFEYTYSIKKLK